MEKANKREPVRTCVGCRERRAQRELVRFVRQGTAADAVWERDPPGERRPGRGVYLCSSACAAGVKKNRRFPGLAAVAQTWPSGGPNV